MRRSRNSIAVLPPTWGRRNPVNLFADATAARYRDALGPLLADAGVDAIVAINTPTAVGDTLAAASAMADRLARERKPVAAVWLEESTRDETRRVFANRRIPLHDEPGAGDRGADAARPLPAQPGHADGDAGVGARAVSARRRAGARTICAGPSPRAGIG